MPKLAPAITMTFAKVFSRCCDENKYKNHTNGKKAEWGSFFVKNKRKITWNISLTDSGRVAASGN